MPMGVNYDFGTHYFVFGGIKLAGYTAFSFYVRNIYAPLRKDNPQSASAAVAAGIGRTAIGLAFGLTLAVWLKHDLESQNFLISLIPLRAVEWALWAWLFFDHKCEHRKPFLQAIGFGIVTSFVLDIPAGLGWLLTGGMWIC